VTARVEQRNALRPLCVVAVLLVPGTARPARVVDFAPLDDEALQSPVARENAGIVVAAEAGRRITPTPVRNVAILDDDIVSAPHFNGADDPPLAGLPSACPLEGQTADHDVGSLNGDAPVMLVAHVDGGATAVIQPIRTGRARFLDLERRVAVGYTDRLAD